MLHVLHHCRPWGSITIARVARLSRRAFCTVHNSNAVQKVVDSSLHSVTCMPYSVIQLRRCKTLLLQITQGLCIVLQKTLQCARNGKWRTACQLYTAALQHVQDSASKLCLHHNRGLAALRLMDFPQALFDASVAAELWPNQPQPLLLRSQAFEAVNLQTRAAEVGAATSCCCPSSANLLAAWTRHDCKLLERHLPCSM